MVGHNVRSISEIFGKDFRMANPAVSYSAKLKAQVGAEQQDRQSLSTLNSLVFWHEDS